MEETYVADELNYCEVWTVKGPSNPACTRCLRQLHLPSSGVRTVKMTWKAKRRLIYRFCSEKRP